MIFNKVFHTVMTSSYCRYVTHNCLIKSTTNIDVIAASAVINWSSPIIPVLKYFSKNVGFFKVNITSIISYYFPIFQHYLIKTIKKGTHNYISVPLIYFQPILSLICSRKSSGTSDAGVSGKIRSLLPWLSTL